MGRKFTVSGTIGLVVLVAALSGTALAGGTPQGVKADGLRLQAIARAYGLTDGSTPLGLKADGLRWQAVANAYGRPASSYYTPQALNAEGLRWAALTQAYRDRSVSSVTSVDKGFNWGDAGVGAVGGLLFAGFVSLLFVFARHSRRAKLAH
jgi:hypothetical protein